MDKTIKRKYRLVLTLIISMLIIDSALVYANITEKKSKYGEINTFDDDGGVVSVTIPIGSYEIVSTDEGDEISVEDFGRLLVPGKPNLPSKIFAIAIPPGAEVLDVTVNTSEGVLLPGLYTIAPSSLPRLIGNENPLIYLLNRGKYEANDNVVYGRDEPYPVSAGEFVRKAWYRKYNLVDVRITPVMYYPLSGSLVYYPKVTANVRYTVDDDFSLEDTISDNLGKTERIAKEIIVNYAQAKKWYPEDTILDKGLHDFVIITLDSLTSSVSSLASWEAAKGRNVKVVTTSWIDDNYPGYDLAEKMRNFLRDKFPSNEWGIEDVLLVGHYDDVPMRRCHQDTGYGQPETDLYFAELSLPDSESWDADEDHQYGEDSDPIDFYSEVNVGRIPWSEPSTVLSICEKSCAYEQNDDPAFKKNILLLGAFIGYYSDTAELMEYIIDADLHPWMSNWTMMRMYEQNQDFYSSYPCDYELLHSNVISQWPNEKFAFVNWGGHGSPYSSHIYGLGMPAFIVSSDCPLLNDEYPAIIFAFACSNSDTEYLNIGQAMLEQGAVGFLGATNVAYGANSWDHPNDGSSQSLDYFFTTCVTSGDYTQGGAHQWALRKMYTDGLWTGNVRFQMFAWGALWGNPDLGMASFGEFPVIRLGDITGGTTGVSVVVSNVGTVDATNVEWNIRIDGGLFMIPREKSGIESLISIGDSREINMSVFGVGLGIITKIPRITVTVDASEGGTIQQTATAQIFLYKVNIK